MSTLRVASLLLACSWTLAACERGPDAARVQALPDTVLAEVAGQRLTTTQAIDLLAANPRVRGDSAEVRVLASLWASYTALAVGLANDSASAGIDLESLVAPAREEALVLKLREVVVPAPSPPEERGLIALWNREGPTVELHTAQIHLDVPSTAPQSVRDSVRRVATSIVQRVRAGERFVVLARQYSSDTVTARRGGDTGFAPRGSIEPPALDSAALALDPGEVSDVVVSPRGFHLVHLIARRARPPFSAFDLGKFGRVRGRKAVMAAEGAYLDSLVTSTGAEVQPGMRDAVRAIASQAEDSLEDDEAARVLVQYRGGTITAEEFRQYLLLQPAERRRGFAVASNEQLTTALKQLVWKELLLAEAARRQIALTAAEETALRDDARAAIDSATRAFRTADGRPLAADSAAARVLSMLRETMSQLRTMPPLGTLGTAIHQRYPARVNERAVGVVLEGLARARRTGDTSATAGV